MDIPIKMPDLATIAEEVRILRWYVEVGQSVKLGQPLLEIETDKAVMDIECIAAGTLKEIYARADESIPVGQIIALVESTDHAVAPAPPPAAPTSSTSAPSVQPAAPQRPAASGSLFGRNKAARQSDDTQS
jgi:pyruvate/2-oxoglutarate dehydrogenase complex dihydrolipoamide acyltransferase (E2) component